MAVGKCRGARQNLVNRAPALRALSFERAGVTAARRNLPDTYQICRYTRLTVG